MNQINYADRKSDSFVSRVTRWVVPHGKAGKPTKNLQDRIQTFKSPSLSCLQNFSSE